MTGSSSVALLMVFLSHSAWGARISTSARTKLDPEAEGDNVDSAPPSHWAKYAAWGKDLEEFARNVDMNEHRDWEFALLEEEGEANSTSQDGLGLGSERKTFCPAHWRDRVSRSGKWVGGGSFGKVYLAKVTCNPKDERTMAFKVQKAGDMVDLEIDLQESFDHPNICKAVDHYKGPKRGQVTMLMEAAGGGDFEKLIGKDRRSHVPDYALIGKLMYQSLMAVEYINKKGVVHSDIKPENIMLSAKCSRGNCDAKVADFGVSCRISSRNRAQSCAGMAGTPLFMSPEMCSTGKRHASDDAWALGVTLHQLIYGTYPPVITKIYQGARSTDDMLRKIGALLRKQYKYRASHNSPLERVLAGLLVADPRNRMTLSQAAQISLTAFSKEGKAPPTPPDSGAPPCWHMCEKSQCFAKKPLKPCLVNTDGTAVSCGADEAEDEEDAADANLIEIVIDRGFSGKCGFYADGPTGRVTKLSPGGAAQRAGLRVGDIIATIQHKGWLRLTPVRRRDIIATFPRVVLEVYRS